MTRLSGRPTPKDQELSDRQLAQLGEAFERLWTGLPSSAVAELPERILGATTIKDALVERLASLAPASDPTCRRAADELESWLADERAGCQFATCFDVVFGRGDPNLDNILWNHDVHLVDFEDSGQSCRAYELAELVEHLGSRGTPDEVWLEFADRHIDACVETFWTARRAFAGFWFLLLLPGGPARPRNPAQADVRQAERLLALLGRR